MRTVAIFAGLTLLPQLAACSSGASVSPNVGVAGVNSGGASVSGSSGGSAVISENGGTPAVAGAGQGAVAGSSSAHGGAGAEGGAAAAAGGASSGAGSAAIESGGQGGRAIDYALPPPSQCHNQDYIDFQEGCREGDVSSRCEGKCNTINACLESSAAKPYADTTFICPRFMLFSDAMRQASTDDGNAGFNYAVVGHDVDRGGIDGSANSTCCQCYQLVFAYPSPNNDRQAQLNPDNPNPPTSGVPVPPPLIVQSFNTAATATTFDVYVAAGGLGANNACAPNLQPAAVSGQYLYSAYPSDGQPSQGGVKPASLYQECKTDRNWVTTQSLSSAACQGRVNEACSQIQSDIAGLREQSQRSCIQSNSPESFYHLNWSVFAMKVECPEHLTQVTGCKLAPQGLPAVDRNVTTASLAASNPSFWSHTGNSSQPYETTTMEDCCRPSCASTDWIAGRGLSTDPRYNAFYSCDHNGLPLTER